MKETTQPVKGRNIAKFRNTDANPEGKGVNGVLLDWYRSRPRGVIAKPRHRVLAELFTSMLILSASFRYRPVVGKANYLYRTNGKWSLSLIAPDEWSYEKRSEYVGLCVLQSDMTWTITASDRTAKNTPVRDALRQFYDAFAKMLEYYQRWPGHLRSYYGFGWRIHQFIEDGTDEEKTIWHHGGSVNNYRNEIALYPEADMGICVLLNSNSRLASTVIPDLYQIVKGIYEEGISTKIAENKGTTNALPPL